jgi:flagellar basal-body rod protein FlgB
MQPIQLFELTSKQAHWLTVRQSVVAGNIANVNTPGYTAREVAAFEAVMKETGRFAWPQPIPGISRKILMRGAVRSGSQNDVEVFAFRKLRQFAEELSKTGEIKRMYELNTGMVKAFHRMMLLTVR